MKITRTQIRKIVREALVRHLHENDPIEPQAASPGRGRTKLSYEDVDQIVSNPRSYKKNIQVFIAQAGGDMGFINTAGDLEKFLRPGVLEASGWTAAEYWQEFKLRN